MLHQKNPGNTLPNNTVIERSFIVDASQQKVWKILLQCLPLEKMHIVNQTTFYAILRWQVGFISMPLNLRGAIKNIEPPCSFQTVLKVKKWAFQLCLEITYILKPIDAGKSEILFTVSDNVKSKILGLLMKGIEHDFAENIFNSVRVRINQLC